MKRTDLWLQCWGCVPSFPANIQIKIPEFCINIFGFKIGNCPPVEGNGGNGGGGQDDPSKDDPTKDEPTKVDPTEIKPSSTGTSCTTTVTATFESVFCSVTEPADAKRRRQEGTSCSTLAYSTITACSSAVGSTTTTFLPQETDFVLCSPETCGGDSCPSLKRGIEKRAPPPRDSEPAANTWADPSNYGGDQKKFIRGGKYIEITTRKTRLIRVLRGQSGFGRFQYACSSWLGVLQYLQLDLIREYGWQSCGLGTLGLYLCRGCVKGGSLGKPLLGRAVLSERFQLPN